MGGTFDPIHLGHLAAAEEARQRLGLARVLFVPAGQPPHKKTYQVTPAQHRWDMTVLATADNPLFFPSRLEIDRPGPSYAVDTLSQLHQAYPGREWYFITGADALLELETWKEPERLVTLCRIVAVTRPGYDQSLLARRVPAALLERTITLEVPGVAVSSTEIRHRVAQGLPIRYLTTDAVTAYIYKYELYGFSGRPSAAS